MRILIGHNYYKISGGEDAVVEAEYSLLKDSGQEVFLYRRSNVELDSSSLAGKFRHLRRLGWSPRTYKDIKAIIKRFRPDVAHFHNIFYVITPAAYFACKDEGIPVVQSQHNFRLLCSNGLFYRQNKVCEDCLDKSLWQGVYHGCYGNSRVLTAFIAGMLMDHWKKGTWEHMVDIYITASRFGRQKLIDAGINSNKVLVKPNFVYPDPGIDKNERNGRYALYVGRLSAEKGIEVLCDAWKAVPDFPLRIIGDGPLADALLERVRRLGITNVEFLGYVDHVQYERNMREAAFLIVPSLSYENFPRVVAEAFAYGVPVVASRLGSLEEIIEDKGNGILFDAGDPSDLARKARWMIAQRAERQRMGSYARQAFEQKYSARQNYGQLMNIYKKVVAKEPLYTLN